MREIFRILGNIKLKLPGYREEVDEDLIFAPANKQTTQGTKTKKKTKTNTGAFFVFVILVIAIGIILYQFALLPTIATSEGQSYVRLAQSALDEAQRLETEKENLTQDEIGLRQSMVALSLTQALSRLSNFNTSYAYRFPSIGQYTVLYWGACKFQLGYVNQAITTVEGYFLGKQDSIAIKDQYYYYLSKWYKEKDQNASKHYVELAKTINPPTMYSAATIYEDALSDTNIDNKIANMNDIIEKYKDFLQIKVLAEETLGDIYTVKGYLDSDFLRKAVDAYNDAINTLQGDDAKKQLSAQFITSKTATLYKKIATTYAQYTILTKSDPTTAIQYCKNAISSTDNIKNVENIYFLMGDINFFLGRYNDAITQYTNALIVFPNSKYAQNAYYNIGRAYMNLGQKEVAISYFTVAISVSPNSSLAPIVTLDLGKALEGVKKFKDAYNLYRMLVSKQDVPTYVLNEATKRLQALQIILNP